MNVRAPFSLGETMAGVDSDAVEINEDWIGHVQWFYPNDMDDTGANGVKRRRTNKPVRCVCLRNRSGGTLGGSDIVRMSTSEPSASPYGANTIPALEEVAGLTASIGQFGVIVDEFVPAAGVASLALFWAVLDGPVKARLPANGGWTTNLVPGDLVVANAAGAVVEATSASSAVAFLHAVNLIGRALETRATTGDDDGLVLINACIRW